MTLYLVLENVQSQAEKVPTNVWIGVNSPHPNPTPHPLTPFDNIKIEAVSKCLELAPNFEVGAARLSIGWRRSLE